MVSYDLKLLIALARTYNRVFAQVERDVAKMGLTISEWGVLEYLYHNGKQPVQRIAEKILVTSGTMSYVIEKLQKKGYVYRERSAEDKRVYYVLLTEDGQRFTHMQFPRHEAFVSELMKGTPLATKRELLAHLITLNKNL
ncbi:MAG: MarR family winged helix-turn-helix transcriptional regulator [Bacilli bacterium]